MSGLIARALFVALLAASGWQVFQQLVARQVSRFLSGPEAFHEALRWDPQGGDYHRALGLHYRMQLDPELEVQARAHFERAIELNPYDTVTLQELATFYELAGERELAEDAHLRALALRPTSGDLLWRVGNFYLRSGELPNALPRLAGAMSADPRLVRPGADLLLGVGVAPAEVERLVPANAVARRRLLDVLSSRLSTGEREAVLFTTLQVWREQLAAGVLTIDQGIFMINRLMRAGLTDVARREWAALTAANGERDEAFEAGENLVWNGDFDRPVFGGELDWVLPELDSYVAGVDPDGGRKSSRALRIVIDGKVPGGLQRAQQRVVVDGGDAYELSAWTRAEGFVGVEVPRLEVHADGVRGALAALEPPPPDGAWHPVEARLEVPDSAGSIVVRLVDTAQVGVEGIAWVDSIQLSPAE